MKEIKFYPDRSYATKIITNEKISLEEAITRCKQQGTIILVLKTMPNEIMFIQTVNVLMDDTVDVREQRLDLHPQRIDHTWIRINAYEFMEKIKVYFPYLEGYLIETYQDMDKIFEMIIPGRSD